MEEIKIVGHTDELSLDFSEELQYDLVLIIGNGFDLNFGLKTSYSDFLSSKQFKNLIESNNKLALHLSNNQKLNNWIDIELELAQYSMSFVGEDCDFQSDYKSVSSALVAYLRQIKTETIDKDCFAYHVIERLLEFRCLVIDFNYTNTFRQILFELIKNPKQHNLSHIKIHGSLINEDIVFGVDDKTKINKDHIFLKKSVSEHFKSSDFSTSIAECKTLMVFGHSLGETDHMYFQKYFRSSCLSGNENSNKQIGIYVYGESSRLNLHKQLDVLTNKQIALFKQNNRVQFIDTSKKKQKTTNKIR